MQRIIAIKGGEAVKVRKNPGLLIVLGSERYIVQWIQ
jgi:hypothetical protein